jgi:dTDP-4-amino-4,6-dideoxygalactose transaminase
MLVRRVQIRLARPELGPSAIEAASKVLASGMLVQGAVVERFERAIAERCGRKHAIAVASGTSALELAIEALDLAGKHVAIPALTWPSPAHAAVARGARPVLVDVDASEWNVRSIPTRVAAAIVIDQFGVPARHDELPRNLLVIEDAACAIGSALGGRACGGFGAIGCLSFHPRKVLTTGEGGMCLTDDDALAARLRRLRNHGQSSPGVFEEASGNHRMMEMVAAIGLAQLDGLDALIARRRAIAERYREAFAKTGLAVQALPPSATRNEQTFGVLTESIERRDALIAALAARSIEAGKLSYALGRLPSLVHAERDGDLRTSESIADRGLALPLHGALTDDDVERVASAVLEANA